MNKNTLALIALSLVITGALANESTEPRPTIDAAHHAYYLGQFDRSLKMYEQLAAAGDAEAAERAGFMLFYGDGYYGRQVLSDQSRATSLLVQAAHAGRSGAKFMLNMLTFTP
jgi:TPR repeat protein